MASRSAATLFQTRRAQLGLGPLPRRLGAGRLLSALHSARLRSRGKTLRELALDLLDVLGLGLERQRLLPLVARLLEPLHAPQRIAEVIVEDRILRLQLHRALEILHRLAVVAEPVVRPPKAVDDIAVVRLELHG